MSNELAHRAGITALEEHMRAELDCVDPDELTDHWFCEGVYLRQLRIPKGFTVTGKIHRHRCINILRQGSIRIALSDGSQTTMSAPHIFISEPGEKKAGYALEDTLWLNVHATEETDLAKIEEHFIVPSFEQLDHERQLALEGKS